jgi:hypothetical protein
MHTVATAHSPLTPTAFPSTPCSMGSDDVAPLRRDEIPLSPAIGQASVGGGQSKQPLGHHL